MKRICILAALTLLLGLSACCPKDEPVMSGKIYETGEFSVWVPDDWTALPVTDPFSDPPGAVKTDCLHIVKGGTTEQDLHSKLYIRLEYYVPGEAVPEYQTETCRNMEEIEPLQLGAYTWYGFTVQELQGRVVLGTAASLRTDTAQGSFLAACWLEREGENITLNDPQLQAILASVTPAKNEEDSV